MQKVPRSHVYLYLVHVYIYQYLTTSLLKVALGREQSLESMWPRFELTTPPLQPLKDSLSIGLATDRVMRTSCVVIFNYNYLKVLIVRTELFLI